MSSTPSQASSSLYHRYANLALPPDAAALAPLCSDTLDALRTAEAEIDRLQLAVRRSRRIGIALGLIMAMERVTEAEAGRLLSNRGAALPWPLRSMAERIICGSAFTDRRGADDAANLASAAQLRSLLPPEGSGRRANHEPRRSLTSPRLPGCEPDVARLSEPAQDPAVRARSAHRRSEHV